MNSKLIYHDDVDIISGFYKGQTGYIISQGREFLTFRKYYHVQLQTRVVTIFKNQLGDKNNGNN